MAPTPSHILLFGCSAHSRARAHAHTHARAHDTIAWHSFNQADLVACSAASRAQRYAYDVRHHTQPSRAHIYSCVCAFHSTLLPFLILLLLLLLHKHAASFECRTKQTIGKTHIEATDEDVFNGWNAPNEQTDRARKWKSKNEWKTKTTNWECVQIESNNWNFFFFSLLFSSCRFWWSNGRAETKFIRKRHYSLISNNFIKLSCTRPTSIF